MKSLEVNTWLVWAFVFQLKTQLTETLGKLEMEESERLKVAGDLYKVKYRVQQDLAPLRMLAFT